MYSINKKSKLVITIGPASDNYETMKSLILAGATCIRANFSHGSYEEQGRKFEIAKQVSKELNIPVSLMLDTKGPEIRVGKMKDGGQNIAANSIVKIHTTKETYESLEGTSTDLSVHYNMSQDLKVGDKVLFDDGKLTSTVVKVEEGLVEVQTLNGHFLKTNKRINLPGVDFSLPFLGEKDKNDVIFGIQQKVDYIAASFVNSAQNVADLRQLLKDNGGEEIKIIAKIESHLGVQNIDEIIDAVDGVMVARGDLGLEIPYYEVPVVQKMIIKKCREKGKLVIVATQMLDSMENNPHPTRAEVTDVYHATELGADSTMLSGESASGKYPLLAVQTMAQINKRAEKEFYCSCNYENELSKAVASSDMNDAQNQLAHEIAKKVKDGNYKYTVVLSESGSLINKLAKFRPNTIVLAVIKNQALLGKYGAVSGVWTALDSETLYDEILADKNKALKLFETYEKETNDKVLVVVNDQITKL